MGTKKRVYSQELKEEILERVKKGDKTTVEIAAEYGIQASIVYRWISKEALPKDNTLLELNRLKRENAELLQLIGELTHDLKKGKKS